jgi:hypothetical protein
MIYSEAIGGIKKKYTLRLRNHRNMRSLTNLWHYAVSVTSHVLIPILREVYFCLRVPTRKECLNMPALIHRHPRIAIRTWETNTTDDFGRTPAFESSKIKKPNHAHSLLAPHAPNSSTLFFTASLQSFTSTQVTPYYKKRIFYLFMLVRQKWTYSDAVTA